MVVFDASAAGDADALHAQALELALRRRGLRTLTLGATLDHVRLARALHAVGPRVVVLTGRHASLDALGRLVFAARRAGGRRSRSSTSAARCPRRARARSSGSPRVRSPPPSGSLAALDGRDGRPAAARCAAVSS